MKKPIDPLIDYLKRSQDLANLMNHLEIKIEHEDGPIYSADRALGAAVYLGKRQGFGSALGFRMSAIFHVLGRILTFQNPGYDFQRLTALISGQKIDGTQV